MREIDIEPTVSPAQLAKKYGCNSEKILAWIRNGELDAFNSSNGAERPRWRITRAAIETFEARRASRPRPDLATTRREKPEGVIEFFV